MCLGQHPYLLCIFKYSFKTSLLSNLHRVSREAAGFTITGWCENGKTIMKLLFFWECYLLMGVALWEAQQKGKNSVKLLENWHETHMWNLELWIDMERTVGRPKSSTKNNEKFKFFVHCEQSELSLLFKIFYFVVDLNFQWVDVA